MQNNPCPHEVRIQERPLLAQEISDFEHTYHMIGQSGIIGMMMGFGRRIMHQLFLNLTDTKSNERRDFCIADTGHRPFNRMQQVHRTDRGRTDKLSQRYTI
ncbi:hypothetical protein D3C80_1844270 [compost metagenome]